MKIYRLFCFLLLTSFVLTHSFRCLFDQHNQDLRAHSARQTPDVAVYPPGREINGRLLAVPNPSRSTMRIQLDTLMFTQPIIAGLNGAATTTSTKLAFVLRTMLVAQTFYQSRLKVGSTASISSPDSCVEYVPANATYANADLVIYVRYTTDKNQGYGATGKSCKYFPGTVSAAAPDMTLQIGRPTVGRIIFNTYTLVDQITLLTNRLFQSITSTAIHEVMHILGFDSTLYSSYLDPSTGAPYSSTPSAVGAVNAHRNTTKFMTTPFVKAWAQEFFNCSTLIGAPLQNQDGSGLEGGSHWQRTAMYDQLMTATTLGTATKYFSGLTFALLKDMGWYGVDDSFAETSNFGYQKGCSFVTDACYGTSFSQFCSYSSSLNNSYCDSDFIGKSVCTNQSALMADGCGMYGQYSSCIDSDNQDRPYQVYTYQVYDTSSFCVSSTLGSQVPPSNLLSRCYPYVCQTNKIIFTIGTYSITCLSSEGGVQKTLSALAGYLVCPDFTSFCLMSRKTCQHFCSQNGYCMDGICNCYTGYYGPDCSQTSCVSGQYYSPINSSCLTQCPSGYYSNTFSRTCEVCTSPCNECINLPTNCVNCQAVGGVIQYFYNNSCYSACPAGTYIGANAVCLPCNTSTCRTCSGSATTCTSCQSPLYLSGSSCVVTCSAPDDKYDEVNGLCVQNCASNQLPLGNSSCVLCPSGQYFYSGSCDTNCSAGYYEDETLRACMQCDLDCLTCDGSYPENCTSCVPTHGNKYLLLKMCWAICPRGFYANPNTYKCEVCPVELHCTACAFDSTANASYCTMCAYGTYFQSVNKTCDSGCYSDQYENSWNNSCNDCDAACATCNGPTSFSCTSCTGSFYLLVNATGGYCLGTCPTIGYIQIGNQCQSCDATCSSCNGISASSCSNCSANYYLSSGYCRYVCPNGTYPDQTAWSCLPCDASCSYCFGSSNSSCTSCASGLYLYNFTCTSNCPIGMLPNQWNVCFQFTLSSLLNLMLLVLLIVIQ